VSEERTVSSNANTGHGHVRPRPDGVKARCGGPALCSECAREQATVPPTNEQLLKEWVNEHAAVLSIEQRVCLAIFAQHLDRRANQMAAMHAHETSDDLLCRIHSELARGHSSAALAVVAAALEHRALPDCIACDVVTLNQNAQKAEEQRTRVCDCDVGMCSMASRASDQYCRIQPPVRDK
jgi:hypothetical protein